MRARSQTHRAIRQGRKRDLAMENMQQGARIRELETALREQLDGCSNPECEMCIRHRKILE